MLQQEDVEGWNKVFSDCPMKQSDLAQPTEGFLVKALVCYLRRFGYKVEPPFDLNNATVENTRDNRIFLIRVVHQIDHFLKITDKSYAFTYYDLIRPTPKKTAHTLYILLNYLFYYNMYKEEVFNMANEPIRKFQEITTAIERTRYNNDLKRQEAENLQAAIETMEGELSMLQAENKELGKHTDSQKEDKKKLSEQKEKLEKSVKQLHEQKRLLARKVVSDDEAQELNKQIEYLKGEFEKLKLNEGGSVSKLREMEESVAVVQHAIKEIEKAKEIIPMRLLDQMRESNKQLEEALKANHAAEQRKAELLQTIEDETQKHGVLVEKYQKGKKELQSKQKTQIKTIEELKCQLGEKEDQATQLQKKEIKLDTEAEEQKEIADYLKENINAILSVYR